MASFFPMRRAERRALFGLVAFSAAAFVPAVAGFSFLGVSLFGWLMALLLFGSPLLLLTLLRPETPRTEAPKIEAPKTGGAKGTAPESEDHADSDPADSEPAAPDARRSPPR